MSWRLIGEDRGVKSFVNDIVVKGDKVYLINGVNGDGSTDFAFTISWIDFLKRCVKAGYDVDYAKCTITEDNSKEWDDPDEWNNIFQQVEWMYAEDAEDYDE